MNDTNSLVLQDVSLRYGNTEVLDRVSFQLKQGETLTIVGPSGCGKSTLLNILGGIVTRYSGEIFYGHKSIRDINLLRGYVPQNLGLLPWKKARENIFLPHKVNKNIAVSQAESNTIIESLGLSDLLKRYPSELSGGQRQRVALARVFISHPDIVLMDEPFSALDTLTAETTRELFLQLWKKNRITTIFTTHNLSEAIQLGKYILLLTNRPARVLRFIENPYFNTELSVKQDITDLSLFEKQLAQWMREDAYSFQSDDLI